jgi:hypothetical protein
MVRWHRVPPGQAKQVLLAVFRILDQGFVDNIGVSYIVASQAAGVS